MWSGHRRVGGTLSAAIARCTPLGVRRAIGQDYQYLKDSCLALDCAAGTATVFGSAAYFRQLLSLALLIF